MTQPTIEPNMTLEQAARKAAEIFRWYEQLHAAKPDMEKAKRNAEYAEMLERALTAQGLLEDAVERAAVAIWESSEHACIDAWHELLTDDERDDYLKQASAAIKAAKKGEVS